ncbi:hypothetical protein, partial [Shewanella algae]|uniref:hypothetical protein n=1 Tax=Shewanella algae TaxID=38313 RepID=UPI00313C772D
TNISRELAGASRTQYEAAGQLNLTGIGCYPWRTQSGFEGLTILFWESKGERLLTWSTSRPTSSLGSFDVRQIFQG